MPDTVETYDTVILPEAKDDMREIALYITRQFSAPDTALELIDDIQDTVNSLRENPYRILPVPEQPWHDRGVRRTLVKNYYVYFIIREERKTVEVTAIIYAGRDQAKQMTERLM